MSGPFLVYGVTPESVRGTAERHAHNDVQEEQKRRASARQKLMYEDEVKTYWRERVDAHKAQLLERAEPVELAKDLATPQRAQQWIDFAKTQGGTKLSIWVKDTIKQGKKTVAVKKPWEGKL